MALLCFVVGFIYFAQFIAQERTVTRGRADGIVALTGGEFRISEGYRLLESGRGKRLLITGVNKLAKRKEIKQLVQKNAKKFDCCVDLDRRALDTIGNATETARWVHRHGFSSIIVVTASYHMPRSLTELRRAMPNVTLLAHSVTPRNFYADGWWHYPGTARILAWEYVKYLVAVARLGFSRCVEGVYGSAS